jgi:hypothetical protein
LILTPENKLIVESPLKSYKLLVHGNSDENSVAIDGNIWKPILGVVKSCYTSNKKKFITRITITTVLFALGIIFGVI